jgi:hypothetical protein
MPGTFVERVGRNADKENQNRDEFELTSFQEGALVYQHYFSRLPLNWNSAPHCIELKIAGALVAVPL